MGDPALENEIRRLTAVGQKIMAIKLYREQTGLGLAEAKHAVEAIAAGAPMPHPTRPVAHVAHVVQAPQVASVQALSPVDLDAHLLALANADRKIEAIKLHREMTGSGLADSKNYVDQLMARGNRPQAPEPAWAPNPRANDPAAYAPAPAYAPATQNPSTPIDTTFGASSSAARSALAEAPKPATMSTWQTPPHSVSTYVPRDRKNFSESPNTSASSESSAVMIFVVTIGLIATVGGAVALFLLR